MTKPNLLYYFRRKDDIYLAVLNRTLEMWLQPLEALDPDGDPAREIAAYIDRKLELSPRQPQGLARSSPWRSCRARRSSAACSRGRLKKLVDEKAAVIRRWIAEGRLAPIDPYHLIFMIWATTQHYADFEVQIRAVLGQRAERPDHFDMAKATLERVFLKGLTAQ